MKKKVILCSILLFVSVISFLEIHLVGRGQEKKVEDKITIVTSFYPMYIAALNVVDGIEGVEVINLTESQTGCLHDYQITTNDMKKLEKADIFIMNGGGMEAFVTSILSTYPNIFIIDTSKGVTFLEGHTHEHETTEVHEVDLKGSEVQEEHIYNAHIWLQPDNYMIQVENIANGLSNYNEDYQTIYEKNASQYLSKIENIKEKLKKELSYLEGKKAVSFHDAFAYLADYIGIEVVHSVDLDGEAGLSAGELAEVVDEVKSEGVSLLFTEAQYSDAIAEGVAKETNAMVYIMDSLVTGELKKDAYLEGMEKNIQVLKQIEPN